MNYSIRSLLSCTGLLFALMICVLTMPASVSAHEVRPAYLQIDQVGEARFNVLWRTPLLSGMRLPVLLRFSDGIKLMTEPSERQLPDSVVERSLIEAPNGLLGQRISFLGLQASITDVLVRVKLADGTVTTSLVRPSQPWIDVQPQPGFFQVMKVFVIEGIEHILFGFDHLLFVLALMLIVRGTRVLLLTITAFTVAHSITLTFATLGWVSLPSGPVETMIAFSIVLIAAEIIRMKRGQTSLTIKAPWVVAFAFGLLHGFGFASALKDLGLPQGDIPLALFSFNVGVEIGQLMFVTLILATVALVRRFFQIPQKTVVASAYCIGIVATFWTLERIQSAFL
ncbi:HupE/UreJ family protein [Pusillimonas sp. ANT_WB101]|uniref:HupE/UreJ family protein n=1 Tax=Pusillimonas sp. ANT_WB101 TaxID=2597356 RepID=UPI0011ED313F|nr:HupE/UreJ family protein [Pusillimonas sp. ANT_WB101]KAA0910801.1 HupE/UreJ family protein [Pusillimonas sp. ANT_WB101]